MAAGSIVIDLLMKTGSFETDTQRAAKVTERETKKMSESFKQLGSAIGLSITGVTATLGVLANRAIETGVQIDRFARLAGSSTEEFQRFAFAAQSVGIQQEKLADIMKDVQDKVGDFLTTGGGPLADFFEKIAPQVGVTADQFAKLSGPEALQLYVSSLQKANLTQAEMIFFLEAIASDSALLLPLLQNNGAALQQLGDDASRLGKIISDETIAATVEFDRNMKELQGTVDALAISFTGPIVSGINGLINQFRLGSREGEGFIKTLLRQTEIARLLGMGNPIVDPRQQGAQPTFSRDDQSSAEARRLGILRAPAVSLPPVPRIPRTPRSPRVPTARVSGPDFSAQDDEIDRITREFERLEDERLRKIQQTQEEAARLYEQTRTPLEKLNMEQARLDKLLSQGAITWDTYSRAVLAAEEQYRPFTESAADAANTLKDVVSELGLTFTSAFEDAIVNGAKLRDIINSLGQDILRITTRKLITEPIGNFLTGALGGGGGNLLGNIGSAITGFFGGAFAGGGDVFGGRPILVGEQGPEMFVPRTAGTIVPNQRGQDSGGRVINVNVTAVPNMTRDSALQQGARIAQGLNLALARNG